MKVSKAGTLWLLIAVVAASLVFANLLSMRHFVRIDLTKDGKYTLSQGSRETMRSLADVMTVTAYFSEGLPAPYASYASYVRDLLEEYSAESNGKIAFEFIDPASEENAEDKLKKKAGTQDIFGRVVREPTSVESELVTLGIQPVEIRVIEDDQQQTKRAYMGLVIRYQGKREVLPVVQDFANFEKDLTVLMRRLISQKTSVVGLISDLPVETISKFKMLMAQTVDLKDLNMEEVTAIPKEVDALLVVGSGRNLSEGALRAIDAFMVSGKNAAFFIDQHEFDPQTLQPKSMKQKLGTSFVDLLRTYHVTMATSLVADVQCASLNMQEQRREGLVSVPVAYPLMPQVAVLNQESPITRGLSGAIFPFASPLFVASDSTMKIASLGQSSSKSWLEHEPFKTDPKRAWRAEEIKDVGPFTLVAQVHGKLKKHFAETSQDANSRHDSRLLVVGTSAFVWDPFFSEQNQALALAALDYLVEDDALIAMRIRNFVDLPLDPDLSDDRRSMVKFANILGMPALLVAFGLVRWRRRESRRRTIRLETL